MKKFGRRMLRFDEFCILEYGEVPTSEKFEKIAEYKQYCKVYRSFKDDEDGYTWELILDVENPNDPQEDWILDEKTHEEWDEFFGIK